jgi:hypothetical protein
MDDISITLEHVDLLNSLDGLDVQLLESSLELLLIGARALVNLFDLSPYGSLAAINTLLDFQFGIMCTADEIIEAEVYLELTLSNVSIDIKIKKDELNLPMRTWACMRASFA